ncbi:MAG: lysophospholipid acyltransferase family protein [Polyangiaceae bacterium]
MATAPYSSVSESATSDVADEAAPTSQARRPSKKSFRHRVGEMWLKAFGWKVDGGAPPVRKAVVVAAPHTSNWDLPFTLATAYVLDLDIRWMGKHTLFDPPLGFLLKALGGLPVDRRKAHNLVDAAAQMLEEADDLLLVVPPEGTRSKASRWKTGFYYIAVKAQVPIILGYLDYGRKASGLGELFYPTGDIKKDFETIKNFYSKVTPKFPEHMGQISLGE